MRVLIDTSFGLRVPSGTGVYLERLIVALGERGVEVIEARHTGRQAPGGGGARSLGNLVSDARWRAVGLPRRARETNADVLHHPLPAHARKAQCPQVVTVHDLAFERLPGHFDPRFRAYARRAHRAATRRADAVVAVSQTTARDVIERWDVPQERVVVAHHGPGQQLGAGATGAPAHFLYVGDDEPRKNLALLLAAHRLYSERHPGGALPLVLAGSAAPHALHDGVTVAPHPGPDQLARLYAGAAALVQPSLHEGFGLTPLEAMSAGVPVVAARSPGTTETCADAALYTEPDDPEALAAALHTVASDGATRADLAQRGRRRAAEFSWAASARAHVEAYTLAMEGRR